MTTKVKQIQTTNILNVNYSAKTQRHSLNVTKTQPTVCTQGVAKIWHPVVGDTRICLLSAVR